MVSRTWVVSRPDPNPAAAIAGSPPAAAAPERTPFQPGAQGPKAWAPRGGSTIATAALSRLLDRLDALARVSDEPGRLTRLAYGPAWRHATGLVRGWMEEAGLATRLDAAGNLVGRLEGARPGGPAVLLGSHLDTVIDAGRFDGVLGVLLGLAAVETVREAGRAPPFALEVVAFADEEGVRFPSALTGSRAMAGTLDPAVLEGRDRDGVSLAEALRGCGPDPAGIEACARRPGEVLAYLEAHIEQGPVLDREGLPLGLVTAIAGAGRLRVEIRGEAGHAGTVPMALRRDALCAAAEAILAVERLGRGTDGLVATVGRIEAAPGAVNTIPGRVIFTVDLRSAEDGVRARAEDDLRALIAETARRRRVEARVETTHAAPAVVCDAGLVATLGRACARHGIPERRLVSGAGHDAMAMAALAPVAMLFLRCRDGISHDPAEAARPEDVAAALEVLATTIALLAEEHR
jgi:allantoate deiminase